MKNYLFITPSISVLGGAELYCLRRARYLKKKGYRVIFITGEKDSEDFLPEFEEYEKINIQELPLFFSGVNSGLFKKLLSKINVLNLNGENYIESHNVNCFLWGESIRPYFKAKHIFYILAEFDINKYKHYKNIIKEGLYKGKWIGITNQSLKICFPKEKKIGDLQNYVNIGFSRDEIDSESKNPKLEAVFRRKVDFRILTVSRLEKTYIEQLIISSIELSRKFITNTIELVVIGDTKDGNEKKRLMNQYKSFENFSIIFLGYIHPLTMDIFKNSQVFVGMGTASINAISQGCPTIIIDPRENLSPGYFADELTNFGFSEDGNYFPLMELMSRGLLQIDYLINLSTKSKKIFAEEFDFETSMRKLDYYITNSTGDIKLRNPSFKHICFGFIWNTFLFKIYQKLGKIIKPKKFLNI